MWETSTINTLWIRFFLYEEQCRIWIRADQICEVKEKKSDCSLSQIILLNKTHYIVQGEHSNIIDILIGKEEKNNEN